MCFECKNIYVVGPDKAQAVGHELGSDESVLMDFRISAYREWVKKNLFHTLDRWLFGSVFITIDQYVEGFLCMPDTHCGAVSDFLNGMEYKHMYCVVSDRTTDLIPPFIDPLFI